MRFHIVTLGCPKNEVDSEGMEVLLTEAGHCPVAELSEADLVIVNTCGFIDAARVESMAALKDVSARRKQGSLLIAAGCLAQREGSALGRVVPGLDGVIGCRNWPEIARMVEMARQCHVRRNSHIPLLVGGDSLLWEVRRKPRRGSGYVKISDGCDAACAFCAIPGIKGPYRSKPRALILEEVRQLVDGGALEVVLVAQDSTAYGLDRGEKDGLANLLREIAASAPELRWLRVLYLYPQRITPVLLETMAGLSRVCRYVDIPLQHTHPSVLQRMRRPQDDVSRLIETLRCSLPDVAIRTTFIVGFPGETEAEHRHLLRSMERLRFDRVGVFVYSPQEGTPAFDMPDQIPDRVKQRRWREAMEVAQRVSRDQNRKLVGKELDVLVEGVEIEAGGREPMLAGRSYRDAPEVDGLVLFTGRAAVGEMVKVRITAALEYDLVGEMVTMDGVTGDGGTRRHGDTEKNLPLPRGEGRDESLSSRRVAGSM